MSMQSLLMAKKEDMKMATHTYKTTLTWTHGPLGQADAPTVREPLEVCAPPEFGGLPGRWTPEALLVLSASSCFMSTFLALAEKNGLTLAEYSAEAEGRLEHIPGAGYRFTEIVIQPVVGLVRESDGLRAQRLLEKAEKVCIISNALDVPVRVKPQVQAVLPAAS